MRSILKYPGSKWTLAEWIIGNMPPHKSYLEPYFGSGAVFFNKPPSNYETINDLDGNVVNFFKVCRDFPDELARAINLTPFSREEMLSIMEDRAGEEIKLTGVPVEDARRFAVRCCQSFGSKLADRAGWKNTKQPKGPKNALIWNRVPEIVYEAAERLKGAQIERTEAVQLIRDYNHPECLIYADPPYLGETRGDGSRDLTARRLYRIEMMKPEAHIELLDVLLSHKGPVIISGYDNPLYNEKLSEWRKVTHTGRSNSGGARQESLWINFSGEQRSLFD
ncbi:DNA adenine methylase [Faecalispora jeddahensis]|uniref:DNA adenine methylase n=1 Tax=Faecalispora jeddahensis TaxID=1414721 RepID=UPI001A9BDB48|nr:DNA adenine methylase [Faecalispora jeddahensis]